MGKSNPARSHPDDAVSICQVNRELRLAHSRSANATRFR